MRNWFQGFAFKWVSLYRYGVGHARGGDTRINADAVVGLYKLTHSLKAPGFNPRAYQVKKLVSSLCFFKIQLVYRYTVVAKLSVRRCAPGAHGGAVYNLNAADL
jgi:hypothetical protein